MRRFLLGLVLTGCAALTGCTGLTAATALQTAHDAARGACALLTGGSSAETLAATAELQKAITLALRDAAEERADPETVRALYQAIATQAGALEGLSAELVKLAGGDVRAVLPPCPGQPPSPPSSGPWVLPPPAASVPVGAAPH